MGPIEAELRKYRLDMPEFWLEAGDVFSWKAFNVLRGAGRSLGLDADRITEMEERMPEVLSEAIEAAEALGL